MDKNIDSLSNEEIIELLKKNALYFAEDNQKVAWHHIELIKGIYKLETKVKRKERLQRKINKLTVKWNHCSAAFGGAQIVNCLFSY